MSEIIYLSKPQWKYLSMLHKRTISFHFETYPNIYKLMYSIMFPSRKTEILKVGMIKLRELKLCLEYFEVDEKYIISVLLQVITMQCKTDKKFLETLLSTSDLPIINDDYEDRYFGRTKNIYGKCLMKVRNERRWML